MDPVSGLNINKYIHILGYTEVAVTKYINIQILIEYIILSLQA